MSLLFLLNWGLDLTFILSPNKMAGYNIERSPSTTNDPIKSSFLPIPEDEGSLVNEEVIDTTTETTRQQETQKKPL